MYKSTNVAKVIKATAKAKNIQLKDMFIELELNKDTLSNMYRGSMLKGDSLAKIADYLDVSVDYLLGRENNEKGIDIVASKVKGLNMENYNEKTSVLVSNVENWNIKNTQEKGKDIETITENEAELLKVYRSLNLRDKTKLMNFVFDMEDKATKA